MKLATTSEDFDRFCDKYINRVKNVHEAGFKYIDLSLYTVRENDELLVSDDWKNTAKEISEYAKRNNIKFVQSHAPDVNPLKGEDAYRNAIEKTVRAMEICEYLNIPCSVIHPGWDEKASRDEWFERNYKFFKELFPVMEKTGVTLLHENTTNANMPWYFSKTGKDMREFSEYVNHPLFDSCWDTGHANIEGNQYNEIIEIGDDLRALHINDNRGAQDEHIIPFMGTMNMDEVICALKAINYKGYFTFESGSTLRSAQYWFGNRKEFEGDKRLLNPPVELQKELERFMYNVGVYILKSYDEYEE